MATYSPIDNTEVDPESPLTSSLFIRLRDNPLAIQEGDPSAPKIVTNALADFAVTPSKMALECRQFTGTEDNGSFIINGTLRVNWIKFTDVAAETEAIGTWQTPFLFNTFFCLAGMNFDGVTHSRRDNPVYVTEWSNTQVTFYNANDNNTATGYAFALGI